VLQHKDDGAIEIWIVQYRRGDEQVTSGVIRHGDWARQ